MSARRLLVALSCAAALLAAPPARAARIVVTNTNDAFAGSLRQAVTDAAPGDTVVFDPFIWGGSIVLSSGPISVTQDLVVLGPQQELITIDTSSLDNTFQASGAHLTLAGVTLSHAASFGSENALGGLVGCYSAATLKATDCTFHSAYGLNGGLVYGVGGSTLDFTRCTLSDAHAFGANSLGGAVYCVGTLHAQDCLFARDTCQSAGGGLYVVGNLALTRCTIAHCSGSQGSAVYVSSNAASLVECTITGNTAAAAVYNAGATAIQAGNCAIADDDDVDVYGSFASLGYNAIGVGDLSSGFGGAGSHDQVGNAINPFHAQLGALQDNGGPTWTMLPLSGSLLVDRAHAGAGTTDARGHARTYDNPAVANVTTGDGTDVGAAEAGPPTHWLVKNLADHGVGSLRQAALTAAAGDSVTFDPSLFGTIALANGEVRLKTSCKVLGPGPNVLAVDGGNVRPAIAVVAGAASLSALALVHGGPPGGLDVEAGAALAADLLAVTDNHAAGIFNLGALGLSRSLIARSHCYSSAFAGYDNGGGLRNAGVASLVNCTFAADSALNGGAISNVLGGQLDVKSSTIAGNVTYGALGNSRKGGGILNAGTATLTSTIVAGNTGVLGGPDCYGAYTSGGYDLLGIADGSSGIANGVNHDQAGSAATPLAAQLGPLADNGGPTATLLPLAGSPAIDKGIAGGLPTDQRERGRTLDDGSVANAADGTDVGACERGAGTVDAGPLPRAIGVDRIDAILPDPAVGAWSVQLTLARAGLVDLALFDVAGRRVTTVFHGALGAGAHGLAPRVERALPAGVYWLRLVGPSGTSVRRLVRLG